MAPKRKSTGPTNRDLGFGINHGSNGKGSKTRVTNPKAYTDNYDQIDWGRPRTARECRAAFIKINRDVEFLEINRGVEVVKGEFVKSRHPTWLEMMNPGIFPPNMGDV